MADNIFDQFDTPASKGGNIFDQFDPPKPAVVEPVEDPRPSFARSMIGTADAGSVQGASPPQQQAPSAGQQLLQSHYDTEAALSQRAAPLVRDAYGKLVRKPIGEIEQFDFGPAVRTPDGKLLAFNPKSDVMLRDPETGKLMAFERSEGGMDDPGLLERVGRALLPGFMTTAPTRLASTGEAQMAVQRGRALGFPVSAKAEQMGRQIEDAAAFGQLEQQPFAPAFRGWGAPRVARTLEEMPLVGGIVKGPKKDTEAALSNEQARIAAQLGASPTDEAAGRVLQSGLDRYRTARLDQLEPGVVADKGIAPVFPVAPKVATSQGAAKRADVAADIVGDIGADVAHTSRGVAVKPAQPLSQVYTARTRVEDLSDAQLQRLARSSASETSIATQMDALYERGRRNLPVLYKRNGDVNPLEIATPNAGLVARGMLQQEESARISGGILEGRFKDLVTAMADPKAPFTIQSLMASRREIGRALANFGEFDARLDRSQLKALYGAASKDLEVGLIDIANRAALGTRGQNQRDLQYFGPPAVRKDSSGKTIKVPTLVQPDVAVKAAQALRDFRVADRYTRMAMARVDKFTKLLSAESPEGAIRSLATRIKEGTIDRGLVRAVTDALRPEERDQILGYLIASLGKARPGSVDADAGWNPVTVATDWNRSKSALNLMFKGTDPAVRTKFDALMTATERMKAYEGTKNHSGTAYTLIPSLTLTSGAAAGTGWGFAALLLQVGGAAALGKFLTSPKYLDWMLTAAASGSVPRAKGPQVGGSHVPSLLANLEKLAANDNELGEIIRKVAADLRDKDKSGPTVEPALQGQ